MSTADGEEAKVVHIVETTLMLERKNTDIN